MIRFGFLIYFTHIAILHKSTILSFKSISMKNILFPLFCLSTLLFSCKKDKKKEETKTYCVGYALKETTPGYVRAMYWENGKQSQLSEENSVANYITINDKDIYITGEDKGQAVYWKNGMKNILPNDGPGSAGKMTFHNGNQYIIGTNYLKQVVWKNGAIFKSLPRASATDSILYYGMIMHQDDLYYTRVETKGSSVTSTYFKNETSFSISNADNNYVSSIAVINSDIYLAGSNKDNTEIYFWKNNVKSVIAKTSSSGSKLLLTGIQTEGNDIYVFFFEQNTTTNTVTQKYWKNGSEYIVPVIKDFYPYVIKPIGGKICQGGWFNSSGVYGAAYFVDNEKMELNKEKSILVSDLIIVNSK